MRLRNFWVTGGALRQRSFDLVHSLLWNFGVGHQEACENRLCYCVDYGIADFKEA